IELEDGKSALKLTTATYTRPNGHNIHRFPDAKESDEWGVKPDPGMDIKLDDTEMSMLLADRYQRDVVQGKAHEKKADANLPLTQGEGRVSDSPGRNEGAQAEAKGEGADPGASSKADSKSKIDVQVQSKGDDSAKQKPTAASKFIDRQLQRAMEYLSTELARA